MGARKPTPSKAFSDLLPGSQPFRQVKPIGRENFFKKRAEPFFQNFFSSRVYDLGKKMGGWEYFPQTQYQKGFAGSHLAPNLPT